MLDPRRGLLRPRQYSPFRPRTALASVIGIQLCGLDVNILVQIGFVVLIGLAAKYAILIVELARQAEDQGMGSTDR